MYNFLDKKTGSGAIATIKAGASVNEELAQQLHKPVIRKFKRRKIYTMFKDNIWAAGLAEMGSLSPKNRGVKYLLCAIDVFTKYAGVTVFHGFVEILNESNHKPNKSWVD